MRALGLALAATAATATLGCSVRTWNDFETGSSIPVIEGGAPFPSQTIGTLLTAQRTQLADGTEVSRLIVGSGRIDAGTKIDGLYGSYSGWTGERLDLGRSIYAHCAGADPVCPDDAGSALAAIADLPGRHRCVLAGAPDTGGGNLVLSCEETDTSTVPVISQLTTGAPFGARIGASLAAIPDDARGLGLALVGAPGIGELWAMDANGGFASLPLVAAPATPAAGFGGQLAVASIPTTDPALSALLPTSDERAFVAVSSPAENRVYLLVARIRAGLGADAVVMGCVDGTPASGAPLQAFGTVLAAGDLDGDGMPEVAIGARVTATGRAEQVRIVSLADFDASGSPALGCADPTDADDAPGRTLGCTPELGGRGAGCEGFGSSLAIDDATGDGRGDLLVGAPLASVGDVSHAGAAYLFRGDASLDVVVSSTNTPAVLRDSRPDVNDTLGLSVTFLPSQLTPPDALPRSAPRAEPVASAPGANRVFVFLCSGLAGDAPSEGVPRCIVER